MKQREREREENAVFVDTLFRDSARKLPGPIEEQYIVLELHIRKFVGAKCDSG